MIFLTARIVAFFYLHRVKKYLPQAAVCFLVLVRFGRLEIFYLRYLRPAVRISQSQLVRFVVNKDILVGKALHEMRRKTKKRSGMITGHIAFL